MAATQTLDDVRKLIERYSNWGRWGADDEKGTLNFLTAENVVRATRLVADGTAISLAVPFDEKGPQTGGFNRFNPIHLMTRDGSDAISGALARDFYAGKGPHFGAADDLVIMPLQCGTRVGRAGAHNLRGQDLQRVQRRPGEQQRSASGRRD